MARKSLAELLHGRTRFGSLSVVEEAAGLKVPGNGTIRRVLCRCDCGAEKVIRLASVLDGVTASCGCAIRARAGSLAERTCRKHGDARASGHAPEYAVYRAMLSRCYNPSVDRYPSYGGRGIRVCAEWKGEGGYERFLASMGRRPTAEHSLDRVDPDGHYEPGNTRWAVKAVQARNKTTTRRVEVNGVSMSLAEAAALSGLERSTLANRLNQGWSVERAMSHPLRRRSQ